MENTATILGSFAEKASRFPEHRFVCYEESWLSYAELDRASSAICGQLIRYGINKGDTVGFYFTPGLELPATLLGILKAGAICVPLDPSYPLAQLCIIADLTNLRLLLTVPALMCDSGKLGVEAHTIDFDHKPAAAVEIEPNDGAYILFTSGTTGTPKAILKTHKSIINPLLSWREKETSYTLESRMLLRSPITHSPFIWELFYPLVTGIELIIATQESIHDPRILAQTIERYQVTHVCLSPAHLQAFMDLSVLPGLTSLVEVDCSGEALSRRIVDAFRKQNPAVLISTYGCTEASSAATHVFSDADDDVNYIGFVNENVGLYLLDSDMNSVDDGAAGEIFLTGEKVASGYLNDEVETRKRFILLEQGEPDTPAGKLFFRTGDLGRKLPTGEIEFLGRADRQVQIRGFRVEPQEIELSLNRHAGVKESAVVPHEFENRQTSLVAYFIPSDMETVDLNHLRQFLLKRLPHYKVPTLFIPVSEFPRNRHHKVDYRILADTPAPRIVPCKEGDLEMSRTEKQIADIWTKYLHLPSILVEDDFFLIGGDSIAALSMLCEIEKTTNCHLSMETLLTSSTIRKLAAHVDERVNRSSIETGKSSLRFDRVIDFIRRPFFSEFYLPRSVLMKQKKLVSGWEGVMQEECDFIVGHNVDGTRHPIFWCCQGSRELKYLAEVMGPDQPIFGMRSGVNIFKSWEKPKLAQRLAKHYLKEIKTIQPEGPYVLGGNCQAADIVNVIAAELHEKHASVRMLILLNAEIQERRPYSLAVFFGENDPSNPFKNDREKQIIWKNTFPEYQLHFIKGGHGRYFSDESDFAVKLKQLLEQNVVQPGRS